MSTLSKIIESIGSFNRTVEQSIARARSDASFARNLRRRWRQANASIPIIETPSGMKFPRLALPQTDDPGDRSQHDLYVQ